MTGSKLVAVLSADMKEYSRHMAEDEEFTLRTFKAYRDEMYPLVRRHGCAAPKDTGDGFLTAFDSAVNAVRCAVEIQQALQPRNAQLPPERRLEFRIGIHSGEVFIEEGELRDDVVNMTARIQTFAEAGGVCISEAMYTAVRGKLNLPYSDMGLQQGKSHDAPIRVYRIDDVASVVLPPSLLPPPPSNPFEGDSTELLGREEEMRRIREKLQAGNHCSIVGPPGSGRSFMLQKIRGDVPSWLQCPPQAVQSLSLRGINSLRELQEEIIRPLGGQKAGEWRSTLRDAPLRLLILDHMSGMDPGRQGLAMRRWLRGLYDDHKTKLLMVTNDRLERIFRKDDPLQDSPLAGLDPTPVDVAPLPPAICRQIVEQRLEKVPPLTVEHFADLCGQPRQPRELLNLCAQRFEELQKGGR